MSKNKYYVVWEGINPGIYDNWNDCKEQVEAFEGAKYKGFASKEEAEKAGQSPWFDYIGKKPTLNKNNPHIIYESIAVDAACSGNPGPMEYRGVYVKTNTEIFRMGPLPGGTNNIGEFLAIVHALALQKKNNRNMPVYSDSINALLWVKNKKCKTKVERTQHNEVVFDLINRAEKWLSENTYTTPILKWQTEEWGEIPADFGRK